jgi:hypothetical protein
LTFSFVINSEGTIPNVGPNSRLRQKPLCIPFTLETIEEDTPPPTPSNTRTQTRTNPPTQTPTDTPAPCPDPVNLCIDSLRIELFTDWSSCNGGYVWQNLSSHLEVNVNNEQIGSDQWSAFGVDDNNFGSGVNSWNLSNGCADEYPTPCGDGRCCCNNTCGNNLAYIPPPNCCDWCRDDYNFGPFTPARNQLNRYRSTVLDGSSFETRICQWQRGLYFPNSSNNIPNQIMPENGWNIRIGCRYANFISGSNIDCWQGQGQCANIGYKLRLTGLKNGSQIWQTTNCAYAAINGIQDVWYLFNPCTGQFGGCQNCG